MKYLCVLLIVMTSSAIAAKSKNDMFFLVGKHPYTAIQNKLALQAIPTNIPKKDFQKIKDRLSVGGKVTTDGQYVILEGCKAHLCDTDAAIVVFDNINKHSYAVYIENLNGALGAPNVQIYQNTRSDLNTIPPIYQFLTDYKISLTTVFENSQGSVKPISRNPGYRITSQKTVIIDSSKRDDGVGVSSPRNTNNRNNTISNE
ncbi:MAG: hypothetical protein GAK29_00875 [Acinetobacter bereziniae]|uniref:Uncharacterized protein n=1 Tax=Acinetobacter bereziniae TaxID=106648 RepID=A0A833PI36_ACIBZ|nr:MAG: hypothetical protein GAK29_00875 [Acinetobacter bereziniae]